MSRLLNGCFAILNIATSSCLLETAESFIKQTRHLSEKKISKHCFQTTARIFVPAVKFPPSVVNDSATQKTSSFRF